MNAQPGRRGGFTLIELLVVTLVLAGVAAAIGACVAAGVRVLDRARGFSRLEARAQIGLALLERDVRNCFAFHAIPFEADGSALAFPALVAEEDPRATGMRIGTVSYEWDRTRAALVRRRWGFPPAEQPHGIRGEDVIAGVRDVHLSYRRRSEGDDEGEWVSSWQSVSNLPASVRIEFKLDTTPRPLKVSRLIMLKRENTDE